MFASLQLYVQRFAYFLQVLSKITDVGVFSVLSAGSKMANVMDRGKFNLRVEKRHICSKIQTVEPHPLVFHHQKKIDNEIPIIWD